MAQSKCPREGPTPSWKAAKESFLECIDWCLSQVPTEGGSTYPCAQPGSHFGMGCRMPVALCGCACCDVGMGFLLVECMERMPLVSRQLARVVPCCKMLRREHCSGTVRYRAYVPTNHFPRASCQDVKVVILASSEIPVGVVPHA